MSRRLVLAALAVLLLAGCALRRPATPPAAGAPDMDGVLTLVGRFSFCHACPVEKDILTAAHCIDPRPWDRGSSMAPMNYSDAAGRSGVLIPVSVDLDRDLGRARGEPEPVRRYTPASAPPAVGDAVVVLGFKFEEKDPLGRKRYEAKVRSVVANHFAYDVNPEKGSSGGCVVRASDGALLGIETWSLDLGFKSVAVAVGVWGNLLKR